MQKLHIILIFKAAVHIAVTAITGKISTFGSQLAFQHGEVSEICKTHPVYRRKIFYIIDLFRQHECLQNIKSPTYKNNMYQKTALTIISQKLELPADVKKKLVQYKQDTKIK